MYDRKFARYYLDAIFDDKSRFYSLNHDIKVTNITNL